MKKRTLWIVLTVLFAASALYSITTIAEDGPSGLIGCVALSIIFGILAKRTDPDARFKTRGKKPKQGSIICGDYTAVDLETTGFSPAKDRIIEFGAVRVRNGKPVKTYSMLINPEREIPTAVTRLTGIDDTDVNGQPTEAQALPEFLKFIGNDVLVGHNINEFDAPFIASAATRLGLHIPANNTIDTLILSRAIFPNEKRHRLVDLIRRFGIAQVETHRPADDALQTAQCYEYIKNYIKQNHIKIR